MISALRAIALNGGAPRVIHGARIEHVCGNPGLIAEMDRDYGRRIVLTACAAIQTAVFRAKPGLVAQERSDAGHRAALDVCDRLARTTVGLTAPVERTYELNPPVSGQPRVVYITCLRSPQHYSGSLTASWVGIYGMTRLTPPWLLHPNELLDGAIGGPASSHSATTTWVMTNNPVVDDLFRGHGVEHDFAGVIAIRTRWTAQ